MTPCSGICTCRKAPRFSICTCRKAQRLHKRHTRSLVMRFSLNPTRLANIESSRSQVRRGLVTYEYSPNLTSNSQPKLSYLHKHTTRGHYRANRSTRFTIMIRFRVLTHTYLRMVHAIACSLYPQQAQSLRARSSPGKSFPAFFTN